MNSSELAAHQAAVPPLASSALVTGLKGTKRDLLTGNEAEPAVLQPGGATLDGPFPLPPLTGGPAPMIDTPIETPLIETFVVEAGRGTGTGGDQRLIDAWLPSVEELSARVVTALGEHGVVLDGPAYVTASLTPVEQVTTTAHVDDDQYVAEEGLGVVAIVASHHGPRIATEPVAHRGRRPGPPRSGLPIELDVEAVERFGSGATPYQQAEPGRIVILARFGQLHAGPVIEPSTTDPVRRLLVFRAGTRPVPERAGN